MLEKDIVKDINNYLEYNGIRFDNELRMGIGIPDISFNIGATTRLKPIDDYFMISILTFVEKRHIVSFNEIREEFLFSLKRVKEYVLKLAKMSLVKITNHIVKAIKNIFTTKLGTTISIEAKLKDWKCACLQAQRYLCFSDYAYVAMPSEYIKNIDINIFLQSGIGLLSVNNKELQEIIPAEKSNKCDFILKYLVTSKIIESNKDLEKKRLRKNIFTPYN